MILPNLIMPGARKSASTTLFTLLTRHRDICGGTKKEPHFFSQDRNYIKGTKYYAVSYQACEGRRFVLDASQSYLSIPLVVSRIAETLGPEIHFICTLRNPIDRAVSAFVHEKIRPGRESKREITDLVPEELGNVTLDELLAWEKQGIAVGVDHGYIQPRDETWMRYLFPYTYFYDSCYAKHISTYLRHFARERFLFLTFEEVVGAQSATLHKISRFLRIDPEHFDADMSVVEANPSLEYRHDYLARVLRPVRSRLRHRLPLHWRTRLAAFEKRWFRRRPTYRFPKDTYQRLQAIFQQEIVDTERLTGLDLSCWKHPDWRNHEDWSIKH